MWKTSLSISGVKVHENKDFYFFISVWNSPLGRAYLRGSYKKKELSPTTIKKPSDGAS
jgi:hypothetical protein